MKAGRVPSGSVATRWKWVLRQEKAWIRTPWRSEATARR
jgi:hypothetical protein